MSRIAFLLALVAALAFAAPASAQTWVRDTPAEDVATPVNCPAGSVLDRSVVSLESAHVRSDVPPVGGVTYVRVSIHGDNACQSQAAFEVIPPPGASVPDDVPVECAYSLLSGSAPCPTVKQPGSYGGTVLLDGRSGSPTLWTAPASIAEPLYLYIPIRLGQAFNSFQTTAQATCGTAEPCPPAQGNARVQVAAQFTTGAAQSSVLYTSVGVRTAVDATQPSTGPQTANPATVKVANKAKRSTLRRGLSVKVSAPVGAKVAITLKVGSRTLARASRSKTSAATTTLKLKATRTALSRIGSRSRKATLTVTVTPPGGNAQKLTESMRISG